MAILAAPAALARSADEATHRAARELAAAGDKAFAKGRYKEALDDFNHAENLIDAPTLRLRIAQCHVKLGKLSAGARQLAALTKLKLSADAPKAFIDAKKQAAADLADLQKRLPGVRIDVHGALAAGARVTIDGVALDSELVGTVVPVDPGPHTVRATHGLVTSSHDFVAREGVVGKVELDLEAAKAPQPAAQASAPPQHDESPPPRKQPFPWRRTAMWASFGVGAAGLVLGATTGGLALGSKSKLDGECKNGHCPTSAQGDINSYDRLTTLSTVGFAVALVGAGVGTTLLLTSPKKKEAAPGTSVAAGCGLGSAWLRVQY